MSAKSEKARWFWEDSPTKKKKNPVTCKFCPTYPKPIFATKADLFRHQDEVHLGLVTSKIWDNTTQGKRDKDSLTGEKGVKSQQPSTISQESPKLDLSAAKVVTEEQTWKSNDTARSNEYHQKQNDSQIEDDKTLENTDCGDEMFTADDYDQDESSSLGEEVTSDHESIEEGKSELNMSKTQDVKACQNSPNFKQSPTKDSVKSFDEPAETIENTDSGDEMFTADDNDQDESSSSGEDVASDHESIEEGVLELERSKTQEIKACQNSPNFMQSPTGDDLTNYDDSEDIIRTEPESSKVSDPEEALWTCSECAERFTESNLSLHMLTHMSSSVDKKSVISNRTEVDIRSSWKKEIDVKPTKVDELHRLFTHSSKEFQANSIKQLIASANAKPQKAVSCYAVKYSCECGKLCQSVYDARRRNEIKLQEFPGHKIYIICAECGEKFETKKKLTTHILKFHKEYPCKFCNKMFKANMDRRSHERRVHGERKHVCSHCGKGFKTRPYMLQHEMRHTGEKLHVCMDCGEAFISKGELDKHHFIHHTRGRPHGCTDCREKFETEQKLKTHFTKHHQIFNCSDCDKSFKEKCQLRQHMISHNDERPFVCGECDSRFKRKQLLVDHQYTHTVEKPFSCSYCDKKFVLKMQLQNHERLHTGHCPFSCRTCPKAFRSQRALSKHLLTHSVERPYMCEQCDKTFKSKKDLKRHEFVHTGEKPHQCTTCGMKFAQSHNLRAHEKRHSDDTPFACTQCDMKFKDKRRLKKHQKCHPIQVQFLPEIEK